jgi:hypothetical protein
VPTPNPSYASGAGNVDPAVRELLLTKVDELTARMTTLLDETRETTEQLAPERARSCRNAVTMASVMIDEIRLRAHARPLDEPEP